MTVPFDAYYQWLGIPPSQQPPTHYRLLGIGEFENNSDVIDNAADRQTSHLRTYQSGQHSAISQKLLKEISAARECLLDPQTRAEYDQQLRGQAPSASGGFELPAVPMSRPTPAAAIPSQLPPKNPPPLPSSSTSMPTVQAVPMGRPSFDSAPVTAEAVPSPTPVVAKPAVPSSPKANFHPLAIPVAAMGGVALVGILGLVLFFFLTSGKKTDPVIAEKSTVSEIFPTPEPENDNAEQKKPEPEENNLTDGDKQDEEKPTDPPVTADPDEDKKETTTTNDDKSSDDDKTTGDDNKPSSEDKTTNDDDKTVPRPPTLSRPRFGSGLPRRPTPTPTVTIEPLAKQAVPNGADLRKAKIQVKQLYGDQLALAKSTSFNRSALYDKILDEADLIEDDLSTQYALLDAAYNTAISLRDYGQAEVMLNKIIDGFDIDAIKERADLLKKAKAAAGTSFQKSKVGQSALELAREAIEQRRFIEAKAMADLAFLLGKQAGNSTLRQDAGRVQFEAKNKSPIWKAVEEQLPKLEKDPDDPVANYVYGRYLVVLEGGFEKGLPMLAKGTNKQIKDAAQLDLENPTDTRQQMAVGEAWFQIAQKELKFPHNYYARSFAWFSEAAPELSGSDSTHVQYRLRIIRSKNLSDNVLERASIDYQQFGQ